MFCKNCGKNIEERVGCPFCKYDLPNDYSFVTLAKKWDFSKKPITDATSRFVAGILQLFTGCIGMGRFYMKSYKIALLQVFVTVLTVLLSFSTMKIFSLCGFLWGVIDGIMILSGKIKYDGKNKEFYE